MLARRIETTPEAIPCSTRRLLRREVHPPRNDMPLEIGDYSLLPRYADGRVARFDTQLVIDRAEVSIHRAAADDESLGDLRVAQVLREQVQHLEFARCQEYVGGGR